MTSLHITGGKTLEGEITPQGAKNEALQVVNAVLLTKEKVRINNIPDIIDVRNQIGILIGLGVDVTFHDRHSATFHAASIDASYLESEEFAKMGMSLRGSIMLIGALLPRIGKVRIPKPGGDKIGRRRLDSHFMGLKQLGAIFEYNTKEEFFEVSIGELQGTYILMEEASVTGTANIIMTAAMSNGQTTIYNAACEPYIQQLCRMLNNMGASITGIGSNLLHIEGVSKLKGTTHTMLPDMIEVGSFIGMAAMTRSSITIKNAGVKHLGIIPTTFQKLGINMVIESDDIIIPAQDRYQIETFIDGSILSISDAIWPGFTPDLLSVVLVTAIQAKGNVLIHQKMFESRLFFVDKLIEMGAKIILCDPHRATVIGLDKQTLLRGIYMSSPDIRAGVALLIAALSAVGVSVIENANQIDRGYQNIVERLNALGAQIRRIG